MRTEIDFASATWKAIANHAASKIEELRAKNDAALSVEQTANIRGRISELKQILALSAAPVEIDVASESPPSY